MTRLDDDSDVGQSRRKKRRSGSLNSKCCVLIVIYTKKITIFYQYEICMYVVVSSAVFITYGTLINCNCNNKM